MDPRSKSADSNIDAGVVSQGALMSERGYTDNDSVVIERAARVSTALVATADVQPAGAQHVVRDGCTPTSVTLSANCLVDCPDLNVTKLRRV